MMDQVNATPTPHKRLPWNKGKLTGQSPPLRPKHVWSIRTKLQIEGRARDQATFNLATDSKLRGCNLAHERPLCANSGWPVTTRPRIDPSTQDLLRQFSMVEHENALAAKLSTTHRSIGIVELEAG